MRVPNSKEEESLLEGFKEGSVTKAGERGASCKMRPMMQIWAKRKLVKGLGPWRRH